MSTKERQNGDFKILYGEWEHHYRRGDIKRAREASYSVIDYLESRGNACKLLSYIDDLEQKGFLPDEIEFFRKRVLSLQGEFLSEEMLHRVKKNCEEHLKGFLDTNSDLKFLQTFSLSLMRFGMDEGLLDLILQYTHIGKSRIIAQAIIDNENLDRPLIENIKSEILRESSCKANTKRDNESDEISENLIMKLSKYDKTQTGENIHKYEEKKLEKKLLKAVDLSDDKAVSDIVFMCLMIQFFSCARFFSEYIQCAVLRYYLQATIIFEEKKYTECINFIDNFFRTTALSGKERSSFVYLQAKSYENLGNKNESSLRYNFLRDQKLYWEFVS